MQSPYVPAGVFGEAPPTVSTRLYQTWSGMLFSSLQATAHDQQPMQRFVSTTRAYLLAMFYSSTVPSQGSIATRLSKNEQFTAYASA